MSLRAVIAACLALAGTAGAQTPLPLANEELLHSARAWEARDRGDLARLALEKLIATRPDSPDVLLELGELYLRMGDIAAAQKVLRTLQERFNGTTAARAFEIEYRFATRDRLQLASVQRLIQIDRGTQARAELKKLFPQGAPGGALALEYYRLLSRTPGGWQDAYEGLRALAARHPDDPRVQLALARHLARRDATVAEGAKRLNELAKRDDVRVTEVDDALLSAIRDIGYSRVPQQVLRDYAARHPQDPVLATMRAQEARAKEQAEVRIRKTVALLRPDIQGRNLAEVEQALAARADEPSATDALAVLQVLRDQLREGDVQTPDAMLAAARLVLNSRTSEQAGRTELSALQLEAARTFRRGEYEAAIEIARKMEACDASSDAAELLATASRLDPESNWLFETRMRWLIDHGQEDAALAALESRSPNGKWTRESRDALRANALEQRASKRRAAGDRSGAIADLEAAIELAPDYPWTRYRLAGIHAAGGDRERGRALLSAGTKASPDSAEMRYAQALYLSSIDEPEAAFKIMDGIAAAARSDSMNELHARVRIEQARSTARRLSAAGDLKGAREALTAVEPMARTELDWARQIAYAWIEIGDTTRGLRMIEPFRDGARGNDKQVLLAWADVLNSADETARLAPVVQQLQSTADLNAEERARVGRLQRSLDVREARALVRDGRYRDAARKLDALLAGSPDDRELRLARADVDLAAGDTVAARDRYASLVAEDPDDVDTRLSYARALTDAGETELARLQVEAARERAPADATDLQLSIARRQLALGDADGAVQTLTALRSVAPDRADVLLMTGRAELSRRQYADAKDYFERAARSTDARLAGEALAAREALEVRRQSWVEAGVEVRSKPGDPGISQYDSWLIPSSWLYAHDYEHRLSLRADAVGVDAGRLSTVFDDAALLGTLQAAGPGAARRYSNDRQTGLSLGIGYVTDTLTADIGTTPLGFVLSNIVGGVEWSPKWHDLDVALGIARRAVTSSVLSYAGLRDPIDGRSWGGVVETGPYLGLGLYRERYSISGSIRASELTGTNVLDNSFLGLRGAADWRFLSRPETRAYAGVALSYWSYDQNLQNYTFGSGGYYSPQSYVSLALPLELQGTKAQWSYRVRVSLSYSKSDRDRIAFYPTDPSLQLRAASSPLPSGYDAPYFENEDGGGFSGSVYAAIERRVSPWLIVGAKLDIDRADYYEPTVFMLYLRHAFGSAQTPLAIPPRPIRAYNE